MASKELVGKVTHYYNKIGVAVVELSGKLKVGDSILIESHDGSSFQQHVESMQIERINIAEANSGDSVGLKVSNPVKEGAKVYKIM
ncbi:MAG: translation elongation factor-like protein [Candidatus Micrarchaeia archaeon]